MNYDYLVLYASRTGNTKRLATEIFSRLPGMDKDLRPIEEYRPQTRADIVFVGFWTDHGGCSIDVMDFLSGLHGQNIALFGTCGMGNSPRYYRDIVDKVSAWLAPDNTFLGSFMCQGKMPIQVRRRFEELYSATDQKELVARLLHYYDEALLHPNQEDFDRIPEFIDSVLAKQKTLSSIP